MPPYLYNPTFPNEHLLQEISHSCLRILPGSHPRGDRDEDAKDAWYEKAY